MSENGKRNITEELENEYKIYSKYETIDKQYLTSFRKGNFKGDSIKPQWVIQALTETFGLCGVGWYYKVVDKRIVWAGDIEAGVFVDVELFYKIRCPNGGEDTWSMPVHGAGGNIFNYTQKEISEVGGKKITRVVSKVDDECWKKAETDALGKACQKLGFGSSIYMNIERTKYSDYEPATPTLKADGTPRDSDPKPPTRLTLESFKDGGKGISREDSLLVIYDEYINADFRKSLKAYVKSKDKKSHDELTDEEIIEFLVSQNQ